MTPGAHFSDEGRFGLIFNCFCGLAVPSGTHLELIF